MPQMSTIETAPPRRRGNEASSWPTLDYFVRLLGKCLLRENGRNDNILRHFRPSRPSQNGRGGDLESNAIIGGKIAEMDDVD